MAILIKNVQLIYCYFNDIIKQWLNAYFLQTGIGMHCIITKWCHCFKHLPEFALFDLKNKMYHFNGHYIIAVII